MRKITFRKVTLEDKETIFGWLSEAHVQEFWDNSQEHKDDIINFMEGRKTPSNYCDGKYHYWIAEADYTPFAMLMTINETREDNIGQLKLANLSTTGNTYGLDYMIGNSYYVGKGYGAKTLIEFLHFFSQKIDNQADTFLIDPDASNPRAKHVYLNAGFKHIGDFVMEAECSGMGKLHHLLIKKLPKV